MSFLFGLFAPFFVNPLIFAVGALAIASPIIIHLLNKRKFRIVDWAAMEFLLDADKKNRRRVRLENLILLLLRCLAMLLIALLLGRLFLPSAVTAGLANAPEFERILVIDDSLSLQVRQGNDSTWDLAKKQVIDLLRNLANQPSDNKLTVVLTSQPEQRPFNGTQLSTESIDEIIAGVEKFEPTDGVAQLSTTLQELEKYIASQPANVNRVLYVVSDLRRRDWVGTDDSENKPGRIMQRLGDLCAGVFVLDVGDAEDKNIVITEVRPEGTLVAGVSSSIDVRVENAGATEARDLKVRLTAGEALPLVQDIDKLAPGESKLLTFSTFFGADLESDAPLPPQQVKIDVVTGRQGEDDLLAADSVAFLPARIVPGIPVLIVDGEPSSDYGQSESFYIKRALSPRGNVLSGITPQVATEQELESLPLNGFQVAMLCNVFRLGEKTDEGVAKLESWVRRGGGLVLMPGDQVDEHFYNLNFYRDGQGLSPFKLEEIRGDETETSWVKFRIDQAQHPVLEVFAGQNNPFLDNVKVFRYWHTSLKPEQKGKEVTVLARWNDADDSPAIVEKPFGKGRVIALSIPADADWANWTSDPSYLLTMQQLVRYLIGDQATPGLLRVGQPLQQKIDLGNYELDAKLTGPRDLKANVQALEDAAAKEDAAKPAPEQPTSPDGTTPTSTAANLPAAINEDAAIWKMTYPGTMRQGFYELKLARRDGSEEAVLFAANVDPSEGNLRRINVPELQKEVGDKVQILAKGQMASLGDRGDRSEYWRTILWLVAAVLGIEQVLGWWFGKRR